MADEPKHKPRFEFSYQQKIKDCYYPEDSEPRDTQSELGEPGHYPFTRGIQKEMYCRQLGYQGRMGIYELLILDESVRPLVLSRAAASTIAQKAIEGGMRTLRTDGWNKVRSGQSTIEEVLRVTQVEEHLKALVE